MTTGAGSPDHGTDFYVMAILGCGDGQSACEEARLAKARYDSPAACAAATAQMLDRSLDLDYPVLIARCRPAGPITAGAGRTPRS